MLKTVRSIVKELIALFPGLKESRSKKEMSWLISKEWCEFSQQYRKVQPLLTRLAKRAMFVSHEQENSPEFRCSASPEQGLQLAIASGVHIVPSLQHNGAAEDTYDIFDDTHSRFACFAVYDGHGGKDVAEDLAKNLRGNIIRNLEQSSQVTDESIEKSLREPFISFDSKYNKIDFEQGSTALVAIIDKRTNTLHVANLGDSRAIICRPSIAPLVRKLSIDHKATNEREAQRIQSADGFIMNQRVFCELAITRTFGDYRYKDVLTNKMIMSEPEIKHRPLKSYDRYLVLATDGLWDKVSNEDVADYIKTNQTASPQSMAENLALAAAGKGSKDDITVLVVQLNYGNANSL